MRMVKVFCNVDQDVCICLDDERLDKGEAHC